MTLAVTGFLPRYNVYSGFVYAKKQYPSEEAVLVCEGVSSDGEGDTIAAAPA